MATSTYQLLLRGLDGKTSCLRFSMPTITGSLIHKIIASFLRLPSETVLIRTGTSLVHPHTTLSAGRDGSFPSCSVLVRLRGGKGGFGSLLRGAATKAGQKKTSNFDACRDMSGRRLRHVNAEKKLKEWRAQAKERELEKAANEFLKKQAKHKENDSGCSQVIEKFREDTSRAREEVESAVASGLAEAKRFGKRKIVDDCLPASSSKHARIWLEKEITEEDGRDSSDDDDDEEAEEELRKEDLEEGSDDAKADEGSERGKPEEVSELLTVENGFEAEKLPESRKADFQSNGFHSVHVDRVVQVEEVVKGTVLLPTVLGDPEQSIKELGSISLPLCPDKMSQGGADFPSVEIGLISQEDLHLDDFHQASDLEALGLERLKLELQKRGLKCGGNLTERAGRLFLLKTVPLEKLDKKHFARARA